MFGTRSMMVIESSWGDIKVVALAGKIAACQLPPQERIPIHGLRVSAARYVHVLRGDRLVLKQAETFIIKTFQRIHSPAPPLATQTGSPFFRTVMRALEKIPAGHVVTYGGLALRAGYPGRARAVGRACGANNLPLFIPCHRVVAAGGKLGGFSSGLAWKQHLLELEQVPEGLRACA